MKWKLLLNDPFDYFLRFVDPHLYKDELLPTKPLFVGALLLVRPDPLTLRYFSFEGPP